MTPPIRERRKRHDGTEIDPVKSLADFVQSFEPSTTATPEAPPATVAAPPAPEVPDEYAGKSPAEIIAEAKANRERAEQSDAAAKTAKEELSRQQTQAEIESTARRIVAEQQRQAAPAAPQAVPPPDPRLAQIEDLIYTNPAEAYRLRRELDEEYINTRVAAETARIEKAIDEKATLKQRREQGNYAFEESMRRLREAGVPEADLNNRFKITAVYTAITLPSKPDAPNPYYDNHGPLNPNVIEQAWRDLFGVPTSAASPAPAPAPAPPVVAPPGSSRPAPAAAPPSQVRAAPISADTRRDYEHIATAAGLDPEKMLARRQARIAREGK